MRTVPKKQKWELITVVLRTFVQPWLSVANVESIWDGTNMLISLCIPCMNRTHDLEQVMSSLIKAANYSPPVELMILDYSSRDNLAEFSAASGAILAAEGVSKLSYKKFEGQKYFHMAHARNLAVLASEGDFIITGNCDYFLPLDYFERIRLALAEDSYVWMLQSDHEFVGLIGILRKTFIAAGGFDERFEFYGKEDKDLKRRLERRNEKVKVLSSDGISQIVTPEFIKFHTNYRPGFTKFEMKKMARNIFEENIKNNVLVANEGSEWGQWARKYAM